MGDGQQRRDLSPPEPMFNVRYASGGIAFAQAEDGDLWRVDTVSRTWAEVTAPGLPKEDRLGYSFAVARDGSYVLAFPANRMWRVPVEMGTAAEPLPNVKVEIVGMGGPFGLPVQLADSPYWLIDLPIVGKDGVWVQGFVVDTNQGRVVTVEDLSLPEEYYVRKFRASPDGRWLAVSLTDDLQQPQTAVYITPSNNLTAGHVVTGVSVAGWHTSLPAVIFRDNATGTLSVVRLPLADGTSGVILNGAMPPLIMLPHRLFAVDASLPARLLQLDVDGNLMGELDLSEHYDSISAGIGAMGRVFLTVMGDLHRSDSKCTYTFVEWVAGP
ncbi:MAG TPA: hypothetical protein VIK33_16605 [Anaerolineae bacterium]